MKATKTKFQIRLPKHCHDEYITIPALTYQGLATHKTRFWMSSDPTPEIGSGWSISHEPTGLLIDVGFRLRKHALACAEELAGMIDWTGIGPAGVSLVFANECRVIIAKHKEQADG